MSNLLKSAIFGLGAAAIWGGMYVVSDVVLPVVPPFTLLSLRLLISVVVLGAIVFGIQKSALPPWPVIREALIVGVVGFGLSLGAQFTGTDRSNAVNGSLITSASPAFILIFAYFILRERLTALRIVSVALATIGVIVIINPAEANFSSETFIGDLLLAVAALTWGLYSVLTKRSSTRISTLMFSFLAPVGGLLISLPAAAWELTTRPIGEITPAITLGILYLGVISTAVAMWAWNRAFALVDASVASLYFFAQPLVGTLLGVLILSQPLSPTIALGGVLIAVGVLISIIRPRTAPAPEGAD
ncbi:MAG: DMT family transporter [Pleurocapsa minor GSE-CHR-MK-17-07R]|jgi:drug/metabolite transporter (DMT)-like permease|nr:DMT family transporter [Pleurocapsa minor GSE-CHR-MK 17-07R]